MTRQKIGYFMTVTALFALLISYAALIWLYRTDNPMQILTGALLTLAPLLLFSVRCLRGESRAFAALALLAPIYLLIGGIIWLWDYPWIGAWLCLWSVVLEVGAVLHNYRKRNKRRKKANHD